MKQTTGAPLFDLHNDLRYTQGKIPNMETTKSVSVFGLVARQFIGCDYTSLCRMTLYSSEIRKAVLPSLYSQLKAQNIRHPHLLEALELNGGYAAFVKSVAVELPQGISPPLPKRRFKHLYNPKGLSEEKMNTLSRRKALAALALSLGILQLFDNLRSLCFIVNTDRNRGPQMMTAEQEREDELAKQEEGSIAEEVSFQEPVMTERSVDAYNASLILPSFAELKAMPFLSTLKAFNFEEKNRRPLHEQKLVKYAAIGQFLELLPSLTSFGLKNCTLAPFDLADPASFGPKILHLYHSGTAAGLSEVAQSMTSLESLDLQLQHQEAKSQWTVNLSDWLEGSRVELPSFPHLKHLSMNGLDLGNEPSGVWYVLLCHAFGQNLRFYYRANFLNLFPACEFLSIVRQMVYSNKPQNPYFESFLPDLLSANNFALANNLSFSLSCETFPSYTYDKMTPAIISQVASDPRMRTLDLQWDLGDTDEMVNALSIDEDEVNQYDTMSRRKHLQVVEEALLGQCRVLTQAKNAHVEICVKAGFEFYVNDGATVESAKVLRVGIEQDGILICSEMKLPRAGAFDFIRNMVFTDYGSFVEPPSDVEMDED